MYTLQKEPTLYFIIPLKHLLKTTTVVLHTKSHANYIEYKSDRHNGQWLANNNKTYKYTQ